MIKFCPWCRHSFNAIQYSSDDEVTTCDQCNITINYETHQDMSELDREFVDELPYGIIVLDIDDIIIRYNRVESELSGMDSISVEGKNFFEDIAPCTAVQQFRGKLQKMKRDSISDQIEFDYTFNHQNFYAQVSIMMTYFAEAEITVISVMKIADNK